MDPNNREDILCFWLYDSTRLCYVRTEGEKKLDYMSPPVIPQGSRNCITIL